MCGIAGVMMREGCRLEPATLDRLMAALAIAARTAKAALPGSNWLGTYAARHCRLSERRSATAWK